MNIVVCLYKIGWSSYSSNSSHRCTNLCSWWTKMCIFLHSYCCLCL